jgi:allophanate hydrolase subunit 1
MKFAEITSMTLALAAAVTALPQAGDDVLILTAGRRIKRLHVRYRIAAAVSELAQSQNLQLNLVPGMEDLVSSYRRSADDRLIRRIDWTLKVLRDYDGKRSTG